MRTIGNGRVAVCLGLLALAWAPACGAEPVSFRRDIAPLLLDHCLACHGPKKAEGGYRVDSFTRAAAAGDSEIAALVAGNLEESEAFRRIISSDAAERMPLDGAPVPPERVELLRRWIMEGAKYDAEDPAAPLISILPPLTYSPAPEKYPHSLPITALVFTPDGERIMASGYHELTVWNVADGALASRISNVPQRTYSLALHPDGARLAVAGGEPGKLGEVRLFRVDNGELVRAFGGAADVVLDAQFRPDGAELATAAADGLVRIYETESGVLRRTIASHADWVTAVAWSADATLLATASRDKTAKVFDAATGELKVSYSGHGEPVQGVAFHPDGQRVYSAGADRKVHLWQVADGKKVGEVGTGGELFKLTSRDGVLLAPSADGTVRRIDMAAGKEIRNYSGHGDWAIAAAYHPGKQLVAVGGFDGRIVLWNAEDGQQVRAFVASPGR